jgi:hypothetical protein
MVLAHGAVLERQRALVEDAAAVDAGAVAADSGDPEREEPELL